MKKTVFLLFAAICMLANGVVFAQDGAMEGIDAYFLEEGYYDNLKDALADPEGTIYLDLSLQSPKLQKIPEGVFTLKNLKYLELAYNQIGLVDDRISELDSLEVLGLNGNKYLNSVTANVFAVRGLKELHLKDTGLSASQLDEIEKKLLKNCKLMR